MGEPVAVVVSSLEGAISPTADIQIIEIAGLYKPGGDNRTRKPPGTSRGSSYRRGYISDDDRGRVFRNRAPDGFWEKDRQYLEITARVVSSVPPIPSGSKVRWEVEEPGDPSSADSRMSPETTKYFPRANDPRGRAQQKMRLEQMDGRYALSGQETLIDTASGLSKVRIHVSDVAGDTYRIRASVTFAPATPAQTGLITVWDRIELEYVKMASARELPVQDIARHYDMACVQVDVSLRREVSGRADLDHMGTDDYDASNACAAYATKASGQFSKEGRPGWFFIASANHFLPAHDATVLYEGDATAYGDKITLHLPPGTPLRSKPAVVRVFNSAKARGMGSPKPNDYNLHVKFQVRMQLGPTLVLESHDFHEVDNPNRAFLNAVLSDYGFVDGTVVPVQVMSEGDQALVTAGISPGGRHVGSKHYFGGKLLIFTRTTPPDDMIRTLCHELCHAFDNAHKCGNWDWMRPTRGHACCMNYWFQFVLDDSTPRRPISWMQNLFSADCVVCTFATFATIT